MGFDANILLGAQPAKLTSPLEQFAQMQQIDHFQNQNQLARATLAEQQRSLAGENRLASLITEGRTPDEIKTGLAQAGYGKQALDYAKRLQEQQKADAEIEKLKTGNKQAQFNYDKDVRTQRVQQLAGLAARPDLTYDTYAAFLQDQVNNGGMDFKTAQQFSNVPKDPAQLRQHLTQQLISVLSPDKQLEAVQPKMEMKDTGGRLLGIQMNPNLPGYGQPIAGAAINKEQSPDSKASVAATIRGQNMTDARAREQIAQGKVPSGYRLAPDGQSLVPIPGGPADQANAKPSAEYMKQAEAYQNMDDALGNYKNVLSKFGGLDSLSPSKRAELNTAYQNSLLQAKEIYRLGVLNGGDERILKAIINNPLDLTSALVPKEALLKQASDLQGIIQRNNENLAKVSKQKAIPLNSQTAPAPAAVPANSIPEGAIKMLRSNPSLRPQFEAKYGPGSAATALGQ